MRPFVVDPAMHLRHSVSQPDFKVSAARDTEVFSDNGKNYVEFMPRIPVPSPVQVQNSPSANLSNLAANMSMAANLPMANMPMAGNISENMPNFENVPNFDNMPNLENMPNISDNISGLSGNVLTSTKAQFVNFRPREAKNMPLAEKVSAWLNNVPWIQVGGDWVSNCYPGHVSSSSRSSNANLHDLKTSPTDQDIFEQQARQITRIITGNYLNNGETTARPITTVHDFSDQRYSDDGYLFDYAHVDMENPC